MQSGKWSVSRILTKYNAHRYSSPKHFDKYVRQRKRTTMTDIITDIKSKMNPIKTSSDIQRYFRTSDFDAIHGTVSLRLMGIAGKQDSQRIYNI